MSVRISCPVMRIELPRFVHRGQNSQAFGPLIIESDVTIANEMNWKILRSLKGLTSGSRSVSPKCASNWY